MDNDIDKDSQVTLVVLNLTKAQNAGLQEKFRMRGTFVAGCAFEAAE
jgi:hypothetical protein